MMVVAEMIVIKITMMLLPSLLRTHGDALSTLAAQNRTAHAL